jgi:hypothetical protein
LKFPRKKCPGKKCPGKKCPRKKWVGEEMSGEEMAREELTIYRYIYISSVLDDHLPEDYEIADYSEG